MIFIRKTLLILSVLSLFLFVSCVLTAEDDDAQSNTEDLYELLGVARDATTKDIRKAFKKLAVKLHPDKNKDDQNADAKFTKYARAYEVLKDPEQRKQYDLFGDIDERNSKKKFHSYTYYRDQFGLYDDDPLVVTLTQADFELNVVDISQVWFVNFYSAQCHHCHELAPTWRKLAVQLEGVIRIGAVNCEEDWPLCRQLGIGSYPTLLYYQKDAKFFDGEKYNGDRSLDTLYQYVLSKINVNVEHITETTWLRQKNKNWLLFLCSDSSICLELETRKKLATIFEGLMSVGIIKEPGLCKKLSQGTGLTSVVFWQINKDSKDPSKAEGKAHSIVASDSKEVVDQILRLLPDPQLLTAEDFRDIRIRLRMGSDKPWLICFYLGDVSGLNIQLKRFPTWLPDVTVGLIHCGHSASLCSSLHISHYPTWGVLKRGGAFEVHHGRDISFEIVTFAKESSKATNLHSLSPAEFNGIKNEKDVWFIDWYSPWCPPCRKLIPELRKASMHFGSGEVKFGTIDCTVHSSLCSHEGIRAYPTTMLYNRTQVKHFHGVPNEGGIVEFIDYMIHPVVKFLDDSSFVQLLTKSENELWLVDYFAPWCAPCNRLTPHWHALAKQVSHLDFVKIAQVDCQENAELCNAQGIRSYPTIRLYPLGSKGLNTIAIYNGYFDTKSIKQWLFSFLPSPVEQLNPEKFAAAILSEHKNYTPWLIDFYAPWCGHCVHFEPDFISVAEEMKDVIKSGKVNCEAENAFCRQQYVTSYPTVILYTSPSDRHEINSHVPIEIVGEIRRILSRHIRDEL